ncbi:MAG: hypothetical protein LBQ86_04485 [Holophagales bacterium]|nr:hypothetical protein [Holophagales bacterium]
MPRTSEVKRLFMAYKTEGLEYSSPEKKLAVKNKMTESTEPIILNLRLKGANTDIINANVNDPMYVEAFFPANAAYNATAK